MPLHLPHAFNLYETPLYDSRAKKIPNYLIYLRLLRERGRAWTTKKWESPKKASLKGTVRDDERDDATTMASDTKLASHRGLDQSQNKHQGH